MKDFVKKEEVSHRCSCGGPHYLTMTRWSGDGDNYTYVDVGGSFRAGSRFLSRLKIAWQLLRHGHASDWVELVIDDPVKADDIAKFMTASALVLRGEPAGGE